MYRIRLASGQEQVYRSIQELTAGVQRGEVTAESEIYHQRTERWLSIESHPHYRMAVEGGTATRQSRLKFTRPSSPITNSGVRPTPPAAERPDQGDLEELNRLLVLLDPLPTPAQRAEPPVPSVQSPPDLTLIRPEPMPASMSSDDPQPSFGTMLRLEDLDAAPNAAPPEPAPPALVGDHPRRAADDRGAGNARRGNPDARARRVPRRHGAERPRPPDGNPSRRDPGAGRTRAVAARGATPVARSRSGDGPGLLRPGRR